MFLFLTSENYKENVFDKRRNIRAKLSEMKGKVTLVFSAQGVTKDKN